MATSKDTGADAISSCPLMAGGNSIANAFSATGWIAADAGLSATSRRSPSALADCNTDVERISAPTCPVD
jgi:hypothetical protein